MFLYANNSCSFTECWQCDVILQVKLSLRHQNAARQNIHSTYLAEVLLFIIISVKYTVATVSDLPS